MPTELELSYKDVMVRLAVLFAAVMAAVLAGWGSAASSRHGSAASSGQGILFVRDINLELGFHVQAQIPHVPYDTHNG